MLEVLNMLESSLSKESSYCLYALLVILRDGLSVIRDEIEDA